MTSTATVRLISRVTARIGAWRPRLGAAGRWAPGLAAVLAAALVIGSSGWSITHRRIAPPGSRAADGAAIASKSPLYRPQETPSFASSLSADHHPASLDASGMRTALVIGINHAVGAKPLQGAVRDAELLGAALTRYGFAPADVTTLVEREATAARIRAELESLAARTHPEGRAVVMFAGHTRKRGGTHNLLAADGNIIPAAEVASQIGRVRAPTWVMLPTCYAEAYALPGIVGPDRVATFASGANELAYELGSNGSYLAIHMVERAMLEGAAPGSVEDAFQFARREISEQRPDRVPSMTDGFPGEFVLGPVTWGPWASGQRTSADPQPSDEPLPELPQDPDPSGTGPAGPQPRSKPPARVCGAVKYNCQR